MRSIFIQCLLIAVVLIFAGKCFANVSGSKANTMMQAVKFNEAEKVIKLLDSEVGVDSKNNSGVAALMQAATYGHTKTIESLLDNGVDVNGRVNGSTAIMYATLWGHNDAIEALLARGADVNAKNKCGMTALVLAARVGRNDTVKILLDNGADESKNYSDTTKVLLASNTHASAGIKRLKWILHM